MKDIKDVNYRNAKRVYKEFNNKNGGDYHDLYARSDKLLLADVFENFYINVLKHFLSETLLYYHFLSAPGLTWQACLKKRG